MAPKIDRSMLKDVVIHASQSVKFDVKIIGEPPPKKTWTFGNIVLKDGGKVNCETEPYRSKLSIINCDKRETGTYKIRAENSQGSDEATVELTVLGECYQQEYKHYYNINNHNDIFKFFVHYCVSRVNIFP